MLKWLLQNVIDQYKTALESRISFRDNETDTGITVNKDWPLVMVSLIPASEVNHAVSSLASGQLRKLPQPPTCLPLMEAAYLVLFHHFASLVLGVVPRI
jgi:hypothetical protein